MRTVRHLLAQRHLAALICAAALLMKLLVPAGYMIAVEGQRIAITLCPSAGPLPPAASGPVADAAAGGMGHHMTMDDGAMTHAPAHHHDGSKAHDRADTPCAFAGLSAALLGPVDPILLATLIAFVLAAGLLIAAPPAPRRAAYLRPPLRGPPLPL